MPPPGDGMKRSQKMEIKRRELTRFVRDATEELGRIWAQAKEGKFDAIGAARLKEAHAHLASEVKKAQDWLSKYPA